MNKKINGSYYTENQNIVEYMVKKIHPTSRDIILEPSVGIGHFIDEIVNYYNFKEIHLYEIDREVEYILKQKYPEKNIFINISDTLTDESLHLFANSGGYYNKIIGNPPYGAYQSFKKRKMLKEIFPNQYVKETYSLFLYFSLLLLKDNGILCFIIPDTFMSLNRHKILREILIKNYTILEILKIPTKIFKTVNFQYSNLVIITIKKEKNIDNIINIIDGFKNVTEFERFVKGDDSKVCNTQIKQKDILKNINSSFLFTKNTDIQNILSKSHLTLGHMADIKTGFYSGNDKKFMKFKDNNICKNRTKLPFIKDEEIVSDHFTIEPLHKNNMYIPILKGVFFPFKNPIVHFIRWDEKSMEFYKNDKKARFQNSRYYFKRGIGVPMVKSKKIRATIFENVIFDQSVVGIFPKENKYFNFILLLLNSSLGNELIHTINHTANNSANYLKQLPIVLPNELQLQRTNELVNKILNNKENNIFQEEVDSLITNIYSGYKLPE